MPEPSPSNDESRFFASRRVEGLVSVIIAVYNRSELIPRTMQSVIGQSYRDIEIIVVDDASSEDVKSVLDRISDPRIIYLRQEVNRGPAAAWNVALRVAKGEFISFLGSDDEWYKEKLERQISDLRTRGVKGAVSYCLSEVYSDMEGKVIQTRTFDKEGDVLPDMLRSCVFGLNSILMRGEDMEKADLFDERLRIHVDWDYLIGLAAKFRFLCMRQVLSRDHWHEKEQVTKGFYSVPKYDRIIYDNRRDLFRKDRKANASFLSNLSLYEYNRGEKGEAYRLLIKSMALDPLNYSTYLRFVLFLTRRVEKLKMAIQ